MVDSWAGTARLFGVVNLCGSSREKKGRGISYNAVTHKHIQKETILHSRVALGLGPAGFTDVAPRKFRKPKMRPGVCGGRTASVNKRIFPAIIQAQ